MLGQWQTPISGYAQSRCQDKAALRPTQCPCAADFCRQDRRSPGYPQVYRRVRLGQCLPEPCLPEPCARHPAPTSAWSAIRPARQFPEVNYPHAFIRSAAGEPAYPASRTTNLCQAPRNVGVLAHCQTAADNNADPRVGGSHFGTKVSEAAWSVYELRTTSPSLFFASSRSP